MKKNTLIGLLALIAANQGTNAAELYRFDNRAETRWASFENPKAERGQGGKTNRGAKGYPYHVMQPGETVVLLDVQGAGVVNRIWMTLDEYFNKPAEMRAVRIDMYWDGCNKPAVSAPLADFFCAPLGRLVAFENELFASPEGRSFVTYIPMPFRKGARIEVTNESKTQHHRIFYDVNFTRLKVPDEEALYFHACWHRESPTALGRDFEILPRVEGRGRFLGSNIGVTADKRYRGWWGEGEAKIYLDGDSDFPTLCGTGTEDYIATGWGQGEFINRFHGCLVSDGEKGLYSFYRFHVPDPVQFRTDCRVTIQQMGGVAKRDVQAMLDEGLDVQPVLAIIDSGKQCNFLGKTGYHFKDKEFPDDTWVNYYRRDDVCATAYFYLDSPTNNLPALPSLAE